jgi:SUKH-3 immunity protein
VTDGVDWLRVPGAAREPAPPIEPPPDRLDDFRFARTSDGLTGDGSLRVAEERGYITDPDEAQRLLRYLTGGAVVVDSLSRGPDLIDPARQLAVPASVRTDGVWVWPGSVEYYLRWHRVAPEPELRARIEHLGYRCPLVEPETVARARVATDRWSALHQERVDAYRAAHPEQQPGDPRRFPVEVNDALVALGWRRERDLGREVEEWLAPQVASVAALPAGAAGQAPYEPFPAALAVMREFGGLVSAANGPGRTSARVPFTIYPGRGGDLTGFALEVRNLSRILGQRAFQVGEVERGMGALVVDESGRVFLAGPVELYAGATIDEALIRMLTGIRCEPLTEAGL